MTAETATMSLIDEVIQNGRVSEGCYPNAVTMAKYFSDGIARSVRANEECTYMTAETETMSLSDDVIQNGRVIEGCYPNAVTMAMCFTDGVSQNDRVTEGCCLNAEYQVLKSYLGERVSREKYAGEGLETEESSLMQRKRGRSPTPRRRRRQREERERQRSRQERRHAWTVNARASRACTTTASTRPLRAPWQRRAGDPPRAVRPTAAVAAASSREPPPRPPVQMGNNTLWWSEIVGLNDPMNDSSTVLPNQTVDMIITNIREMTVEHRTYMLAELIPFVAAFMSELLRAVATGIEQSQQEIVEVPLDEEDESALLQQPGWSQEAMMSDDNVLMQMTYDPSIPFGSRLSQLQAQLNGMRDGQSAQVVVRMKMMIGRLRQLAGDLAPKHRDRFERLEALLATYVDECEATGGGAGKTPEVGNGTDRGSGAASSTDVVTVNDSSGAAHADEVPEYRVRRHPDGPWIPATDQEAAEFRAHDQAVQEEALRQARSDADNYQQLEAAISQQWDDWAMRTELERETPLPSRKRIRVVMNVGDAAGHQLGEAQVEGVVDAGEQPVVSFQVMETLLGTTENPGVGLGPAALALHANPQLAAFDPESMPGLSEHMKVFMESKEARYWLHQFAEGTASDEMICSRFGSEALEVFQMWVAIQDDVDMQVRNCGDVVCHAAETVCEEEGAESDAPTVAAGYTGEAGEGVEKKGYIAPMAERNAESEGTKDAEGSSMAGEAGVLEKAEATELPSLAGGEEASENAVVERGHAMGEPPSEDEAEDTIDPLTGIPSRWAAFWRATNQNASIGAGLPDPAGPPPGAEGSLSDGFCTLPGNDVELAEGETALVTMAADAASTSENQASSSTDGKKQSNLKGWLK